MATMGLALPWEARISNQEQERGSRVDLRKIQGVALRRRRAKSVPKICSSRPRAKRGRCTLRASLFFAWQADEKSCAKSAGQHRRRGDAVQETF